MLGSAQKQISIPGKWRPSSDWESHTQTCSVTLHLDLKKRTTEPRPGGTLARASRAREEKEEMVCSKFKASLSYIVWQIENCPLIKKEKLAVVVYTLVPAEAGCPWVHELCVYVFVYARVQAPGVEWKASDPLQLELQVFVSCSVGDRDQIFALYHWAISPTLRPLF